MKNMAQLLSSISSVIAPLWKGNCFCRRKSKRMMSVNNKISCLLKRVVGFKGAPSFDIYVKVNKHGSQTDRNFLRKFDIFAVVVGSDHNKAEEKVVEISPNSSLYDWGNFDSNSDVKSVFTSAVSSKDGKIYVKSAFYSKGGTCSEVYSADYLALLESVPLRLYRPDAVSTSQDVEWTMMKVLTPNDCNEQHRLLVWKKLVEDHILPHFDEASRQVVNTVDGLRVNVLDCDMDVEFGLTLKKWPFRRCYGLTDGWKRDFAERRGLNIGDEIGLRWDKQHNRLQFTVFRRSPLTDYLAKLR